MTDITVSLDDLETLVMAVGGIKTIEAALDTRKHDPFIPPHNKITEAAGRLAAEVRSARRSKETYLTPWNGELEDDERAWLEAVCQDYDPDDRAKWIYWIEASEYRSKNGVVSQGPLDKLVAKGMLLIGNPVKGVIWPGADQPEFTPDPRGYFLMPTPRGLRKWQELKAPRQGSPQNA